MQMFEGIWYDSSLPIFLMFRIQFKSKWCDGYYTVTYIKCLQTLHGNAISNVYMIVFTAQKTIRFLFLH